MVRILSPDPTLERIEIAYPKIADIELTGCDSATGKT